MYAGCAIEDLELEDLGGRVEVSRERLDGCVVRLALGDLKTGKTAD